jgi:hypothetical protein
MKFCEKCGEKYRKDRKAFPGLCWKCSFWAHVKIQGPDDCWLWTGPLTYKFYGHYLVRQSGQKMTQYAHRISWHLSNGDVPDGMSVLHCCDARYPNGDLTNRRCVNPNHLKLGTNLDNVSDRVSHGRSGVSAGDKNGSRLRPERLARGDKNGSRLHPEKRPRGDLHWTRIHPDRIAKGDANGARTHRERLARGERNGACTKPEMVRKGENHGRSKLTESQVIEIRQSHESGLSISKRMGITDVLVSMIRRRKLWKHIP